MLLGVEVELHVVGNPNPGYAYETDYRVVHAHAKGENQGTVHYVNGHLVEVISNLSNKAIQIGYDATASFGKPIWFGFELASPPLDLEGNREIWRNLYAHEVMQYFTVDPRLLIPGAPAHHSCGMHVHISGDMLHKSPGGADIIYAMTQFLSFRGNVDFITAIAGRYGTRWCKPYDLQREAFDILFHSNNCGDKPNQKIDREEDIKLADRDPYDDEPVEIACCDNLQEFWESIPNYHRGALNPIPNANTGDIELRLFASPADITTLTARLDFAHALVVYCQQGRVGTGYEEFCLWLQGNRERRGTYRNLFRMLRDKQYVQGLIPRARR